MISFFNKSLHEYRKIDYKHRSQEEFSFRYSSFILFNSIRHRIIENIWFLLDRRGFTYTHRFGMLGWGPVYKWTKIFSLYYWVENA